MLVTECMLQTATCTACKRHRLPHNVRDAIVHWTGQHPSWRGHDKASVTADNPMPAAVCIWSYCTNVFRAPVGAVAPCGPI